MKLALVVSFALCAMTCSRAAMAYRPFDSTDASVADAGEFEVEFGPAGYLAKAEERFLVMPATVLNLGVGRDWEIVLEGKRFLSVHGLSDGHHAQLLDTGLSLKGVLREGNLQDKKGPSVATELGLLLPTVDGEQGVGAIGTGILSQRGSMGTIHFNGALSLTRAQRVNLFASMILEGPFHWPARPVAEFWAAREFGIGSAISGLLGVIWQAGKNLSFDIGVRRAREDHLQVFEVRAGLTWTARLWDVERSAISAHSIGREMEE